MYDFVLHLGIEHPNLLWIVVAGLITFGLGLGLGLYTRLDRGRAESDEVSNPE